MIGKADHIGRIIHYDNWAQARSIRRYQSHLWRVGKEVSIEQAARCWITKYAALWRHHREHPRRVP